MADKAFRLSDANRALFEEGIEWRLFGAFEQRIVFEVRAFGFRRNTTRTGQLPLAGPALGLDDPILGLEMTLPVGNFFGISAAGAVMRDGA
jgi:hypothetical protein